MAGSLESDSMLWMALRHLDASWLSSGKAEQWSHIAQRVLVGTHMQLDVAFSSLEDEAAVKHFRFAHSNRIDAMSDHHRVLSATPKHLYGQQIRLALQVSSEP
jgi:hypothetical protein